MKVFLAHTTPVDEQIYFIIHEMLRSLLVCRGRGAQHSEWRLAGCGQAQKKPPPPQTPPPPCGMPAAVCLKEALFAASQSW